MTFHRYLHRVRYRECDRMGVVYHVHYLDHFEAARTELLRAHGVTYKQIEDSGVLIQVVDVNVRYRKPAYYDDLLEIRTTLEKPPVTRLELLNEVRRVEGDDLSDVLVEGRLTLCFLDRARGRPVRAPEHIVDLLTGKSGQSA